MGDDITGEIYFYDPDPRAILPLEQFYVPKRLARTVRKGVFDVRFSTDFRAVITACSDRSRTWITEPVLEAYVHLHEMGLAHSVECWQDDVLVGGLYGVTLRGLYAGESMFSRQKDASKVALVHLVERLKERGFTLLDTQFTTPHLKQFGVVEIPKAEYKSRLARALQIQAVFNP